MLVKLNKQEKNLSYSHSMIRHYLCVIQSILVLIILTYRRS